ncbi:hypothetical protein M5K25_002434 [Dendrobium thyrsiflorum]|uniref:CCHC-type domain-containing protein n=1 Tax=Dendrobium thyrsiflorum TaxID=117978 RepID=A0ABD0VMJ7_DENTH
MVNMFKSGKKELARICVRINLDSKLPHDVWMEVMSRKFFHKIEYEKISSLCFKCEKIGHKADLCLEGLNEFQNDFVHKTTSNTGEDIPKSVADKVTSIPKNEFDYGPWTHVKFRKNRKKFVLNKNSQKSVNNNVSVNNTDLNSFKKPGNVVVNQSVINGNSSIPNDGILNSSKINDVQILSKQIDVVKKDIEKIQNAQSSVIYSDTSTVDNVKSMFTNADDSSFLSLAGLNANKFNVLSHCIEDSATEEIAVAEDDYKKRM